jgi:hypothetical protein
MAVDPDLDSNAIHSRCRNSRTQEAKEERDRMRDETVTALARSAQVHRKYGSSIIHRPSLPVVNRQIGTELRDIRTRSNW